MAGNVIVGGIIGAGVVASGAMLDLTPNPVVVTLNPETQEGSGTMKGLLTAVALIAATPALATAYDETELYSNGGWRTHYVRGDNGSHWCSANTWLNDNQMFAVQATADDFIVQIYDSNWSMNMRKVSFYIDMDYEHYEIDGWVAKQSAFVRLAGDDSVEFLRDLAARSALTVYNGEGDRLLTVSLRGSAGAIESLAACYNRIFAGKSVDPFGASTVDPF